MQIESRSYPFVVANPVSGNVTTASITFPVPQIATPSGDGVIPLGAPEGGMAPNSIILVPYGAGTATNTFSMSVYGWKKTTGNIAGSAQEKEFGLWIAMTLATFTCTLGTVPGIVNRDVNASQLFCGTIALVTGNANVSVETVSPTGNDVGHIVLDAKGSRFAEIRYGTGSSATSCNCLYSTL